MPDTALVPLAERPIRAKPKWGPYQALEYEARRALGITRRLGRRLHYEQKEMQREEEKQGRPFGAMGLPNSEWRETYREYMKGLVPLLSEHRRYLDIKLSQPAEVIDITDESEALMGAVSLLTDEELRTALERRNTKALP